MNRFLSTIPRRRGMIKLTAAAFSTTPKTPTRKSSSSSSLSSYDVVVGVFLDLDNIVPENLGTSSETHTRENVATWIRPIKQFSHSLGKLDRIRGYGNEATQTFQNPRRLRLAAATAAGGGGGGGSDDNNAMLLDQEQEWWQMNDYYNNNNIYDDELVFRDDDDDDLFPGAMVQTGYDESGDLRCGICGAKMKLNKKDRARGWTVQDKLDKHMRMLHDREQKKRANRRNMNKKKGKKKRLPDKEMKKFQKYKAAQVGLDRKGINSSGNIPAQKRNDLFQILKEESVKCFAAHDVDKKLMKHAKKWIQERKPWLNKGKRQQQRQQQQQLEDASTQQQQQQPQRNAVLVVASGDADFLPLFRSARDKGIITVTANPKLTTQTSSLVEASDIVLAREEDDVFGDRLTAKPQTARGFKLLQQMESTAFSMNLLADDDSHDEELRS